jgi:hypothetical protein
MSVRAAVRESLERRLCFRESRVGRGMANQTGFALCANRFGIGDVLTGMSRGDGRPLPSAGRRLVQGLYGRRGSGRTA